MTVTAVTPQPPAMIRTIPLDVGDCRAMVASPYWAARTSQGDDGCVEWTGYRVSDGYGMVGKRGPLKGRYAHRVATVAVLGRDIEPGYTLDHLCRNRACVNPDHLVEKTQRDNTLCGSTIAADQAARIRCPAGHPLNGSGADLRASHAALGKRECRVCHKTLGRAEVALRSVAQAALGITRDALQAEHGRSFRALTAILTGHGIDPARVLMDRLSPEDLRVLRCLSGQYSDLARSA